MTTIDKAMTVVERLESLGSAGAIADFFIENEVTGEKNSCETCPVANHIRDETADDRWLVGADNAWMSILTRDPGSSVVDVRFGENVQNFITNFDDGEYPELVKVSD